MVQAIEQTQISQIVTRKTRLMEIIGPAGAGKTTLARVLMQHSQRIEMGADIELRKIGQIPAFLRNLPFVFPLIVDPGAGSRMFRWDEIKSMVYLRGWHHILSKQPVRSSAVLLLDQGPIFRLATLHAFGPARLGDPAAQAWWQNMFRQWAESLDLIVSLDAPDAILQRRINLRERAHLVKGKTDPEAHEFLKRYRASYEYVVAQLTAGHRPRLLKFDTSQTTIEEVSGRVLEASDLLTKGN